MPPHTGHLTHSHHLHLCLAVLGHVVFIASPLLPVLPRTLAALVGVAAVPPLWRFVVRKRGQQATGQARVSRHGSAIADPKRAARLWARASLANYWPTGLG